MKIGEFARLGQVSVRMLRHYEGLGLLAADSVDDCTGHRHYSVGQLARLNRIMGLSSLGIPLRQIAALLDSDLSPTGLAEMLRLRRHQLQAEKTAAETKLAEVDFRLALIERTTMNHPDCIIKELPAERILGRTILLGDPPFDTSVIGPLFGAVATQIAEAGGAPDIGVGLYSDSEAGTEVTVGYRVGPGDGETDATGLDFTVLPAGPAATLIHEGSMSRIGASWQNLSEWCLSQGYELAGPCREIYLEVGSESADDPGWVVELQQPFTV